MVLLIVTKKSSTVVIEEFLMQQLKNYNVKDYEKVEQYVEVTKKSLRNYDL